MKRRILISVIVLFYSSITFARAENWPQWRGPSLNGISTEKNLPRQVDDRRKHRLETGDARMERINSNHLARPNFS